MRAELNSKATFVEIAVLLGISNRFYDMTILPVGPELISFGHFVLQASKYFGGNLSK